ncbi:MAG TPA: cell division protein FtsK, partial [Cytophagales bacterium]|nr:cell division protein FtsK [Cytophagales bacterium]
MAKNTPKGNHFKKKSKTKKAGPKFRLNLKVLKDRRLHLAVGFFLLIASVYLLTAQLSYLFTGKADQSVVESVGDSGMVASGLEVQNWLGLFGALLSHYFIYKWFGIAGLLFPPLLFIWGYRIVFRRQLFHNTRTLAFVLFFSLWMSVLFGTFTLDMENPGVWSYLGGGIGYEVSSLFYSLIGWGTFLFLILALLIFTVYFFNITDILGISLPWKLEEEAVGEKEESTPAEPENSPKVEEELEAKVPEPKKADEEDELEGMELIVKPSEEDSADSAVEDPVETMAETSTSEPEPVKEETSPEPKQEEEVAVEEEDEDLFAPPTLDEEEGETTWTIDSGKKKRKPKVANEEISFEVEAPTPPPPTQPEPVPVPQPEPEPDPIFEVTDSEEEVHKKVIEQIGEYDPTLDLPQYQYPTVDLLKEYEQGAVSVTKDELEANKDKIVETLTNFKIGITSIKATIGPTVTLYEIVPEPGVKISKIKNLEDDIALSLAALGIRIIAPIPGKGTIGIEVPNKSREMVDIRTVVTTEQFADNKKMALPIALGRTISNEVFVTDLAKMPHLLMAGATGQGKSVGLNVILTCLLYKRHPAELKFVLVDPKKVELTLFNTIERHFLAKLPGTDEPIITDTKKVIYTLNSLCVEMDNRYDLLKDAQCRNIKEYNAKFKNRKLNPNNGHRYLPYIVLVIDELADLMVTAGKEIETPIARLAQLARAIG